MGEEESLKFFSKFNEQEIRWKDQKFEISSPWIFHAPDPRSTRSDKWLPLAGGSRSKKKNPGFLYNPIHLWPGCSHPLLLAAAVVVVGSRQLPLSLPFSFSLSRRRRNPRKFHDPSPFERNKFCPHPPLFHSFKPFSRKGREREREVCVVSLFSKKEGGKLIETREFWESFEAQDLCEEKKRRKGEKRLSLLYFLSNGSSSSN